MALNMSSLRNRSAAPATRGRKAMVVKAVSAPSPVSGVGVMFRCLPSTPSLGVAGLHSAH